MTSVFRRDFMGLESTPRANRVHIGIFGRRNSGKSSLINAICNQQVSIVSDFAGTTTDPVYKSMEILPLGATLFIDTPGLDDVGDVGKMRVERAKDVLKKCDIAILVCTKKDGFGDVEKEIEESLEKRKVPYITVFNKCDEYGLMDGYMNVSAKSGENIPQLREKLALLKPEKEHVYIADIIKEGDSVILVTPIDESAPKGRIILPQQNVLREVLDKNAIAQVVQPGQLKETLENMKKEPKLVVTDSQAFGEVSKIVPDEIPLTSFSIIFARKKGNLAQSVEGANAIEKLSDGDTVLISEGCTHHRQCNDIGSVKLPNMLKKYTGKNINIELTSGTDFPGDLSKYALVIHCGGCMLQDNEVSYRYEKAKNDNIPMTNYGIAMAKMQGILERTTKMF